MRTIDEIIIRDKTLKEHLELHKKWLNDERDGVMLDLRYANLRGADLRGADLRYANLRDADLRDANLDFSCLPLWCGGINFKIDERQAKQLMYHVINLMQYSELDVNKVVKKEMFKWLSDSHLVVEHELPILEEKDE